MAGQFGFQPLRQFVQPVQLVGVFVGTDGLTVGNVEIDDTYPADGYAQYPPLRIVQSRQVGDGFAKRQTAEHRHAVVGFLTGESGFDSRRW